MTWTLWLATLAALLDAGSEALGTAADVGKAKVDSSSWRDKFVYT